MTDRVQRHGMTQMTLPKENLFSPKFTKVYSVMFAMH